MLQDKDIPVLDDERLSEETASNARDDATGASEARTLTSQINELIEDVRVLARAETEYYRTKLSVNLAATKRVLLLFGVAVVTGIMAIIALILGLLLVLSQYVGPLAATGIIVGLTLLVASVTMGMAIKRAKKLPLDENNS
ncbi:phage holin family protein [Parasphingorhabdus flavimaris]|uniref:phage holin family protein n=1 Tax=Parasphingorhabdus flavimaris TaxID=266812 RepID=UPI00300109F1